MPAALLSLAIYLSAPIFGRRLWGAVQEKNNNFFCVKNIFLCYINFIFVDMKYFFVQHQHTFVETKLLFVQRQTLYFNTKLFFVQHQIFVLDIV